MAIVKKILFPLLSIAMTCLCFIGCESEEDRQANHLDSELTAATAKYQEAVAAVDRTLDEISQMEQAIHDDLAKMRELRAAEYSELRAARIMGLPMSDHSNEHLTMSQKSVDDICHLNRATSTLMISGIEWQRTFDDVATLYRQLSALETSNARLRLSRHVRLNPDQNQVRIDKLTTALKTVATEHERSEQACARQTEIHEKLQKAISESQAPKVQSKPRRHE